MQLKEISLLCLVILMGISCTKQRRPNIVLIMADDLGYGGIGCYGNKRIQTPHLDELAKGGLLFTDFHSNGSVCTPTRAALLTGRYQQRAGLEGVIYVKGETREVGLNPSEITIAKMLQQAGYATGIIGKWHLGYQPQFNPVHFGFDEFRGYVSGNIDFHSHYDNAGIFDWWHNLDTIHEEGYVTDLITKHSLDFIEKNQDEPFFLYVPHEAPHVPFQGRTDTAYRFPGRAFTYYGPVRDRDRAYKDMVEAMDEGVGAIVHKIRDLDLEENTMIVFISDNGGETFGHNGVLSGSKISLMEGGHRVPAIVYWKNKIRPGKSDATVMSFDWMPTFLNLASAQNLAHKNPILDGFDLSQHLLKGTPVRSRHLFWRYRHQRAVRKDQYKLFVSDHDTLLFDLENDLEELHDLSPSDPERAHALANTLLEWEHEMNQVLQKTR